MSVRDPNLELLQETNQLICVAEFKGWTLDEFLQSLSWLFITLSFFNCQNKKIRSTPISFLQSEEPFRASDCLENLCFFFPFKRRFEAWYNLFGKLDLFFPLHSPYPRSLNFLWNCAWAGLLEDKLLSECERCLRLEELREWDRYF